MPKRKARWQIYAADTQSSVAIREIDALWLFILIAIAGIFFFSSPPIAQAAYTSAADPRTDTSNWTACTGAARDFLQQRAEFYTGRGYPEMQSRCRIGNNGQPSNQLWFVICTRTRSECIAYVAPGTPWTPDSVFQGPYSDMVYFDTETGAPIKEFTNISRNNWVACNDNGQPPPETPKTEVTDTGLYRTEYCSPDKQSNWVEECNAAPSNPDRRCRIVDTTNQGDTFETATTYTPLADDQYQITSEDNRTLVQRGQSLQTQQTGPIQDFIQGIQDVTIQIVAVIIFFVTEIIIWILLGILALIGWLLDSVVVEFVIQMGKYVTSEDATAVRTAWTLIRDLANIGIIGGLVATAIGNIIGSGNYSIQKNLSRLILAALLVNFSYFVAGTIIDIANYTAREAYYAVAVPRDCESNCGIASRLLAIIELSKFHDDARGGMVNAGSAISQDQDNAQNDLQGAGGIQNVEGNNVGQSISLARLATFNVMEIIFIIVISFVFLSAISLLVARFIALIFIIVTSPVGIAGVAVPFLKKYADEWWKAITNQSIFAPVYFLLIGISLKILAQYNGQFLAGPATEDAVGGAMQSVINVIIMFVMAIGFSWIALSIAKKMSAESSEYLKPIYDAANKGLGWLPKTYQNLLGRGAISTIGSGADWTLERYNKFMAKDGGVVRKALQWGLRRVDQPIKGALTTVAKSKFGGKESFEDLRTRQRQRAAELTGIGERERGLATLLDPKNIEELETLHKASLAAGDPESSPAAKAAHEAYMRKKGEMEKAFSDIPPEALQRLRDRREWNKLVKLSPHLSSAQFKNFAHDKEIPKNIRNQMHEMRFKNLKDLTKLAQGKIAVTDSKGAPVFDDHGHIKYRDITIDDVRKDPTLARYQTPIADSKGKFIVPPNGDRASVTRDLATTLARPPTEAEVRDRMKEIREPYQDIQNQLYTLFKYGGIVSEDVVPLMRHDPSLLENQTLLDGGMTHGSKMAILQSPELGAAQHELAKTTWQTSVREALQGANTGLGIDLSSPNEYADRAKDPANLSGMVAEFNTDDFKSGVARVETWLAGKQPQEVAGQIHDTDLLSPAFAAALNADSITQLTTTHDPVYWKPMLRNLVAVIKAGYASTGTPEEQAETKGRLASVMNWFSSSGARTSGMTAALQEAMTSLGIDRAQIEANLGVPGRITWA